MKNVINSRPKDIVINHCASCKLKGWIEDSPQESKVKVFKVAIPVDTIHSAHTDFDSE